MFKKYSQRPLFKISKFYIFLVHFVKKPVVSSLGRVFMVGYRSLRGTWGVQGLTSGRVLRYDSVWVNMNIDHIFQTQILLIMEIQPT